MEVITLKEVMEILRLSESTIRRRLRDRRKKKSSFPLPFTGSGHKKKALWHREEIENWVEDSHVDLPLETPTQQKRRLKSIHAQLKKLRVEVK